MSAAEPTALGGLDQATLKMGPVARRRRCRGPFEPARSVLGPYRLPHDIDDRLCAALAPYRNRQAAYLLAVFLARFWSSRDRVALPFPVDRRALAGHRALDLSEARVRGALGTLEAVGFLARFGLSGARYRATEDGLRRKAVPYQFGADYLPLFQAANARAARARAAGARRALPDGRAAVIAPNLRALNSPKSKSEAKPTVLMGDLVQRQAPAGLLARQERVAVREARPPTPPRQSDPGLERALDRLFAAIRQEGSR